MSGPTPEQSPDSDPHYLAVLAFADPSITRVRLPSGFRFETPGWPTAMGYLIALNRLMETPIRSLSEYLASPPWPKWDPARGGVEFHRLRDWAPNATLGGQITADDGKPAMVWVRFDGPNPDVVALERTLSLMRLFKEGNIGTSRTYQWNGPVGTTTSLGSVGPIVRGDGERYTLSAEEAPLLQALLDRLSPTELPPDLRLAWSQLELSYVQRDPGAALISIVTGLESALSDSTSEVRYRLSRNVAALLASNRLDFQRMVAEVKEIYDVRSKFIHSAKRDGLSKDLVLRSRHFLREVIKHTWVDGWVKADFLTALNARGFA